MKIFNCKTNVILMKRYSKNTFFLNMYVIIKLIIEVIICMMLTFY